MTEDELYEDLMGHFKDGMDDSDFDDLVIVWENAGTPPPPVSTESWIRVDFQPVKGGQQSLSGANGRALYRRAGLVSHQIFTAKHLGVGTALAIAEAVTAVYDGKRTAGGVWFRNTTPTRVGPSDAWHQVNVVTAYEYSRPR